MKYSIIITLLSFSFCFHQELSAQDFEFTQFDLAPLHLNPANAGNFDGKLRVSTIYRDQWRKIWNLESSKSGALSIDTAIPYGEYSEFGIGLQLGLLRTGALSFWKNRNVSVSASFTHYLIKEKDTHHAFSFGFNLGNSDLKIDGLTFGANNEPSLNYFDLGAGILWKSKFGSGFKANIGYSIFHVNGRGVPIGDLVKPRHQFHGVVELPSDFFTIVPSFVYYFQEKVPLVQIQLASRFYFNNNNKYKNWAQFGLYAKSNGDENQDDIFHTFGLAGQFNLENFLISMSFDRQLELRANSIEVSFGYIIGQKGLGKNLLE